MQTVEKNVMPVLISLRKNSASSFISWKRFKLLLLCWFLSNTFKTKKIQVKPEIHFYDFLQRHDSFEEAKNFSQFKELFMLDQLSEESL